MATALLNLVRLNHREVNIVPGDSPTQGVRKPGQVGFGEALITVFNPTDQEQDIDVEFVCDDFPSLRDWVTLRPLAPKVATTAKDRPRDQNRKYTVPVAGNQSRDIAIHFKVGLESRARAGAYEFKVRARVKHGSGSGVRELEQEAVGVAIIRPFYRWKVESNPSVAERGPLRRRKKFTLNIINEGNDWLYVDVKVKDHPNLWVQVENKVIAVPPPSLDGTSSNRSVTVLTKTKLRFLRGEVRPTDLPIALARKDAPSVAPLADGAVGGFDPAGLGQPVLSSEAQVAQSPNSLQVGRVDYEPWIPTSVEGCWNQLKSKVRSTIMTVIGLFVMYQLLGAALVLKVSNILKVNRFQVTREDPKVLLTGQYQFLFGLPTLELTARDQSIPLASKWNGDKWELDFNNIALNKLNIFDALEGTNDNIVRIQPIWSRILWPAKAVEIKVGKEVEPDMNPVVLSEEYLIARGETGIKEVNLETKPGMKRGPGKEIAISEKRIVRSAEWSDTNTVRVTVNVDEIQPGKVETIGGTYKTYGGVSYTVKLVFRKEAEQPEPPDSPNGASGNEQGLDAPQAETGIPKSLEGFSGQDARRAMQSWAMGPRGDDYISQAKHVLARCYLRATGKEELRPPNLGGDELSAFRALIVWDSSSGLITGLSQDGDQLSDEDKLVVRLASASYNRAKGGSDLKGAAARLENDLTSEHLSLTQQVVPGLFD